MIDDIEFTYFVQQKFMEHVSNIKRFPDRWNMRCPVCGDSKKNKSKRRGWYYIKSNSYYCWNGTCPCSEKGLPILKVISLISGQSIKELKFEYLKNKGGMQQPEETKYIPTEQKKQSEFKLKNTWVDLNDKLQEYIKFRRVLDAPYKPLNWQFYFDKQTNRLVIPWVIQNQLKCYQLRAINSKQSPKYLFPYNVEKPVFGIDNIDESFPYLFMLEGAFDSIWVKNGVAIGGVYPTDHQSEILNNYLCDPVYFFDNPMQDPTALKRIIRIATDQPTTKIFIMPSIFSSAKDVNEVIIRFGNNPFTDKNFLKKHIYSGVKALLQVKMS